MRDTTSLISLLDKEWQKRTKNKKSSPRSTKLFFLAKRWQKWANPLQRGASQPSILPKISPQSITHHTINQPKERGELQWNLFPQIHRSAFNPNQNPVKRMRIVLACVYTLALYKSFGVTAHLYSYDNTFSFDFKFCRALIDCQCWRVLLQQVVLSQYRDQCFQIDDYKSSSWIAM